MLNNEIWKTIIGFEERYEISNLGRIRSIQTNHNKKQSIIRKQYIRSKTCQYSYVQLWCKNKGKAFAVHRLVAIHFIPNPAKKPMVNHLDGNKLNNNWDNLEWCTYFENHKHAFKTKLRKIPINTLNQKRGKTSKYRNVTYDVTRHRWLGCVKIKGKMYCKRFPLKKFPNAERLAAQAVNDFIDKYKLTDRIKNIII